MASRTQHNHNQKQNDDVETLKQCFGLPQEVVVEVYNSLKCNFENAYKALSEMQQSDEDQKRKRLTPALKLTFLSVVFDKLSKNFVESTLTKYNWSVEASLDDLLTCEERRAKEEEDQRQKIEAERQRREMEQRLIEQQQREEIERNNKYFYLQAMFPRLDRNFVLQALQSYQWNTEAAYHLLFPIEQKRQYDEEQERLARMEQARLFEERQHREQEERLEKEAEEMKAEQLEQVIAGATNWDDIYANFLNKVKEVENNSEVPEIQKEKVNEQQAMVEITKDIVPFLSDGEILKVFNEKNWEVDKSLPILEEISKQKFKERVQQVYPNLSQEDIESVVQECFPDDSLAIEKLRGIATHREIVANLETAAASAKQRLDEAQERQQKFELERKETIKKQQFRVTEMEKFQGTERDVFSAAHEMVQQWEEEKIEEGSKKYLSEVSKAEQEYKEVLEKLNKEKLQSPLTQPNNKNQQKPKSTADRRTVFDKILAERKATYKKDREDHHHARQGIIAQKLFKELGHHRFGVLQEAIGRAPGGVARGYAGIDYHTNPSEPHPSSIIPSAPVIIETDHVSVTDTVNKFENTKFFPQAPPGGTHGNTHLTTHTPTHPPSRPTAPTPEPPRQYAQTGSQQIPTQQQTQIPTQQQTQFPTQQQTQFPTQQQTQTSTQQQHQFSTQIPTQQQTQFPTPQQTQFPTPQQTQFPTPQQQTQFPTPQQTQFPTPQQTQFPVQQQQTQFPTPQQTHFPIQQQQTQFPTPQQQQQQPQTPLQQLTQPHLTPRQQYQLQQQQQNLIQQTQIPTQQQTQFPTQQQQTQFPTQQQYPPFSHPQYSQTVVPTYPTPTTTTNYPPPSSLALNPLELSVQELQTYDYLFQLASKDKIHVTMQDASFLHYSHLHIDILSQIWSLASNEDNKLTRSQFHIALRLIAQAQNNIPLSLQTLKNPVPLPVFNIPYNPYQGGGYGGPVPVPAPYYYPAPQGTQGGYPGTQNYPGNNVNRITPSKT